MTCFQPCEASQQPKDQTVEMLTLFHLQTAKNNKQARKPSLEVAPTTLATFLAD